MDIAILILEEYKRDSARIRSLLNMLPYPVRVIEASDLESGRNDVDLVILGLPRNAEKQKRLEEDLANIRSRSPDCQVILVAPKTIADIDSKILVYQARSLLLKPLDQETFSTLLEKVLPTIQRRKERAGLSTTSRKATRLSSIVGKSEQIQRVLKLLEKVSESASTSVLLLGETGTGKSLFARYIHELSDRSRKPFIEINCAALPASLMESELFGHEPGAFTDAKTQKIGLIELADGGTLFFDEVTEIGLQTQAKLLKFLDSKNLRRLGGDNLITVDARIIAASNRNLKEEVRQKHFREDLFYRLNVVEIRIPPLRERKSDVLMIAKHYLDEYKTKFNKRYLSFAPDAIDMIEEYSWPGNVRELINIIERAVLLCKDEAIRKEDLPIQQNPDRRAISISGDLDDFTLELPQGGISLEMLEKKVIEEILKRAGGNVLKASRMLSVTRGTLRYKMMKYKIDPKSFQKRRLVKV
ncbi:MAG: AAA domain-containing protein [Candidatus Latescibacteria bacterium]|nr:AAA domain-containing protein [Candidatus Latescibacterota bacterium]NIM22053.1 AAA domain-containing protein [Candidatus Latescibacterota bacterium]NIM66072.1 AAA domain-containing protein [Candidatus Latescibacterota bacterium]NIO02480.1 AAA domain-containing protein [Candidatus Latescibacterota bacterium]NIO29391.1 AAA domain-containing protein [Candidatus Latescibacterota bacterium]